jgi:CRP/FNR family cyclic AMP-dependent transcriptional regulator
VVDQPTTPHIPDLADFLAQAHRRRYPVKTTLIWAGDEGDSLFYILSGSVSVVIVDDEGREMVVAYLNPGDFFGEMGLFDQEDRSAWIRTKTDCDIAEISYDAFRELVKTHPDYLYAVGRQLAQRLRDTTRKVGDLAFLDVTGRVARTLMNLCTEPDALTHPNGMQIKITRQEIGRLAGCSREMVGRVLKSLEEEGRVELSGKTMVVHGTR